MLGRSPSTRDDNKFFFTCPNSYPKVCSNGDFVHQLIDQRPLVL
jgi:hypothetical protein